MQINECNSKLSNPFKIFANTFIAFTGAGVLGLPYAFKQAGLAEGIILMIFVGYASIYAMCLLVDTKRAMVRELHTTVSSLSHVVKVPISDVEVVELNVPLIDDQSDDADENDSSLDMSSRELSYSDLGELALGSFGRILVDSSLVFSQIGFCCAYLLFMAENLSSFIIVIPCKAWLFIIFPPLFLLCLLRNLNRLSIFSLFAQFSTISAFAVVFWFDFEHYHVIRESSVTEFSLQGFPFFIAVSIYCYEGAGLILSLEASLHDQVRPNFKYYFCRSMLSVTLLYIVFGSSGYLSFGNDTRDIITLNLPHDNKYFDFAKLVKLFLCVSLFFTYPLMMVPVFATLEKRLKISSENTVHQNILRLCVVLFSVTIVLLIPNFANLMSLIGGTCCSTLAFTLPGLFHYLLLRRAITWRERMFDRFLIALGLFASVITTLDTIKRNFPHFTDFIIY